MQNSFGQKGFTFIEIVIASLILSFIVMAVVYYHSSAGAAKGQEYYLKAVQVTRSELEKLRVLYELDKDGDFGEFVATGPPPSDIYLFRFAGSNSIQLPSPIFRVYYDYHGYENKFLRPLGSNPPGVPYAVNTKNTVKEYGTYYKEQLDFGDLGTFKDDDQTERKTFTFYTDDDNNTTDSIAGSGRVDASIVVIDEMGSPDDEVDDLLAAIGWWVEDVDVDGKCKKITFALQFWYPAGNWQDHDPEVIVLKSIFVRP